MMIKQIFKMIWNQRRLNGWIWMELLVVFVALWYLVDMFVVQLYSYTRPMGYDITNCWKLSFDVYPEDADEYVNDTTQTQTEGEALAKILERLRRAPEVDNACVAFYSSPYSDGNDHCHGNGKPRAQHIEATEQFVLPDQHPRLF